MMDSKPAADFCPKSCATAQVWSHHVCSCGPEGWKQILCLFQDEFQRDTAAGFSVALCMCTGSSLQPTWLDLISFPLLPWVFLGVPPAASGFREPLDWCPLVALLWAGSILGVEEKERIPEKKKIWESLLYISAWEYLPDHRDRSGVMGVSCIAGRFFTIGPPGNPRRCNFLG